jgi:hypothetical protein
MYAATGDYDAKTPFLTYLKRFCLGVVMLKVGYEFGSWDSKDVLLEK